MIAWVLPVASNYRQHMPGIVHRASDTGATLFIEPSEAVELNNDIVRITQDQQQEVARILWELAHLVHLNRDAILASLKALARLDMLVAKARYAIDHHCVRPRINRKRCVDLRTVRHPLLVELIGYDHVVPIDVRVGEDFDLLIVTGPNTWRQDRSAKNGRTDRGDDAGRHVRSR